MNVLEQLAGGVPPWALAVVGLVLAGFGLHRIGRASGRREGRVEGERVGQGAAASLERAAADGLEARGQASAQAAEEPPKGGKLDGDAFLRAGGRTPPGGEG